jgi:hypothetical protein
MFNNMEVIMTKLNFNLTMIILLLTTAFCFGESPSALELDLSEFFSERDLTQLPNREEAQNIKLKSGRNVLIRDEGIYLLSGNVENTVIIVDAPKKAKVQFILDGLNITNKEEPAIYIKQADKVFITSGEGENSLTVTDTFIEIDGKTPDAVIYSKSDLVLNGQGSLKISSAEGDGIISRDDFKITGGNLWIEALKGALRAKDKFQIADGTITIEKSREGIEATRILIAGGSLDIHSDDDGINATEKSSHEVSIEIYGGKITIKTTAEDSDAIDSNGDLSLYGGEFTLESPTFFDATGEKRLLGEAIEINGKVIKELSLL